MSQEKMYSAFISSVYRSLRDERRVVIDALLDRNMIPVGMEHFTAAANAEFSDIERRIDEADVFILLLGSQYGSLDKENKISWTEREYRYALSLDKPILAIVCDELDELLKKDRDTLTDSQKRQIAFYEQVPFARTVSPDLPLKTILEQFLSQMDYSVCAGWVRGNPERMNERILEAWQNEHRAFNLGGTWYHIHLSADDERYIRVGTIEIRQSFDPVNYKELEFEGYNFSIAGFDRERGKIRENRLKSTHWTGKYTVDENGTMFGIFLSKREFRDTFNEFTVDRGIRRGIHDFKVDVSQNVCVREFSGEFHDEAPSPKTGRIYAFRTEEERLAFIQRNFDYLLDN